MWNKDLVLYVSSHFKLLQPTEVTQMKYCLWEMARALLLYIWTTEINLLIKYTVEWNLCISNCVTAAEVLSLVIEHLVVGRANTNELRCKQCNVPEWWKGWSQDLPFSRPRVRVGRWGISSEDPCVHEADEGRQILFFVRVCCIWVDPHWAAAWDFVTVLSLLHFPSCYSVKITENQICCCGFCLRIEENRKALCKSGGITSKLFADAVLIDLEYWKIFIICFAI